MKPCLETGSDVMYRYSTHTVRTLGANNPLSAIFVICIFSCFLMSITDIYHVSVLKQNEWKSVDDCKKELKILGRGNVQ